MVKENNRVDKVALLDWINEQTNSPQRDYWTKHWFKKLADKVENGDFDAKEDRVEELEEALNKIIEAFDSNYSDSEVVREIYRIAKDAIEK